MEDFGYGSTETLRAKRVELRCGKMGFSRVFLAKGEASGFEG